MVDNCFFIMQKETPCLLLIIKYTKMNNELRFINHDAFIEHERYVRTFNWDMTTHCKKKRTPYLIRKTKTLMSKVKAVIVMNYCFQTDAPQLLGELHIHPMVFKSEEEVMAVHSHAFF